MRSPKLSPCPFCGCKIINITSTKYDFFIYCSHCEVSVGPCYKLEHAVKRWNQRVKEKTDD